eukprot:CAMPEP_0173416098 /NCGR_PEP_ID=MMETSP1356-20130122/85219_1 /TAXON_ID=77927 ORGANISM="Hemiselmis virescens, Strain PCC157" /NCGR_SAMPLE_ID=MMETSP1356 /ASSEMBLY_ACC=CAM_ASM_000847 /LENGTH=504 /DNA_ID=CAMNT_0014378399 /DNA_START=150 /DNA_END=1664 /DNA_ORIENTATION=-
MAPMRDRVSNPSLVQEAAFINGDFVTPKAAGTFSVHDPASGALLGSVPDMGKEGAVEAISAAHASWAGWRDVPAKDKSAALRRWHELILTNTEDLAIIITSECGKPLAESKGEVAYAASFVDFFAEEVKRIEGAILPPPNPNRRVLVSRQGVGVCSMITPWNFPAAMITRKVAPALAAGCPSVVKPAQQTPFTALALAELARQAGIPKGLLNIVTSSTEKTPEVGRELATHSLVRKVSFTGSTAVGKTLLALAAGTVKRVSMELGGNAPFIVLDDADIDAAVEGAMSSKFRNAGQTCVCANRFLVQEGVAGVFAQKFADKVRALKVGHGLEEGVTCGPLVNAAGVNKADDHVLDCLSKGASALVGEALQGGDVWAHPPIMTFKTEAEAVDAKPFREETFGPIAPIMTFKTEAEAVEIANDTTAGLAAYVYTRDLNRAFRLSEALDYGMVGVNEGVISSDVAPFGGMKESGLGREGSRWGMEEYTELKYVCLGIGKPIEGLPALG